MNTKFKKIAIIGMGFIGGSMGKAILKNGIAEEVIGICRRQVFLDKAIKKKSLTKGFINNYEEALKGVEIIVIATPVHIIKNVLTDLEKVLDDKTVIVTDVGSTKKEIVEYAAAFTDKFSFIGGHPLAGSEKVGVEYSNVELFKGTLCVLTRDHTSKEEDLKRIECLWKALGAEVDIVDPLEHDAILSSTSHLPHVVAYALAGTLKKEYAKYTSTGFKDTTRIASSDPVLWSDVFLSNKDNVLESIRGFRNIVEKIEDDIRNGREQELKERLGLCKGIRDEIV